MIIRRPARILVEFAIAIALVCGVFFAAWYLRGDAQISEPDQLRDKLTAAGLGCTDYVPATVLEGFAPGVYRAARCRVVTEDTLIVVWAVETYLLPLDARAFDRGCTGNNSLATKRLTFVVGDVWVVEPETDETARAIQSALGGRIEALSCGQ